MKNDHQISRRKFLKTTGLAALGASVAGGLVIPTTAQAQSGSTDKMVGGGPVPSVSPKWAIPAYTGFDHITVTSITMNTIDVLLTTGELPFVLFASSSNVTTSATRNNGVGSVYPYTMLEHSWVLTYNDDSPIKTHSTDNLTNARGGIIDPYRDHKGGEFVVPIREAGTYKLTLTSKGPDGVGGFLTNSTTETITVSESTYRHEWYDGLNGDDSNDGFDPWGFALTTASYTESTGALNQTNAFTSYDHTAATAGNPTDWYNWIYITSADIYAGGTWHRITAKNSNSKIVISPKLGADDTNVISSSGAKEIFIGAARKSQANGGTGDVDADRHDTFVHLRGNQGATTYTFTEPFTFALGRNFPDDGWGDVHKHIGGYDSIVGEGVKILGSAALNNTDEFLNKLISTTVNSQGNIARFSGLHNLELDGNEEARDGFGGRINEGLQEDDVMYFVDRIQAHDCLLQQAGFAGDKDVGSVYQVCVWKPTINNHRNGVTLDSGTHTGSSGATSITDSTKTWTANEWIDETFTVLITQSGNICQGRITANTSDTLTILSGGQDGGLQDSNGDPATINNGDSYEIVWPKSHAMFCNTGKDPASRMALIGGTWTTPSDRFVRDHYIYPSGKNHMLFAYNYFSGGTGSGPSYTFNTSIGTGSGTVGEWICIVENFAADGFQWFCDGGGNNNDYAAEGRFENMIVARNGAKPIKGFLFSACIAQCVALDNVQFGGDGYSTRGFYGYFSGRGADIWDYTGTDYVTSRNLVYGLDPSIDDSQHTTDNASAEIVDNIVQQTDTDAEMVKTNFAFLTNRVYKDNNFYGPNDINGIMFTDTTGPDETLLEFNTTVGETNTATDPGWTDPENGDFT